MATAKDAVNETVNAVNEATGTAARKMETVAADTKKAMTEQMDKAAQSMESAATFGQDTLDALMKSQNVAAKAAEEIQAEILAFSKKAVEDSVAHAKDLASAHTVTEFIEKQSGFAKASMEAMVRQTTKMNELMVSAAKEIFAPLAARTEAGVRKASARA